MLAQLKQSVTSLLSHGGLKQAQEKYQFNYTHIPPVAMVDTLPEGENFPLGWYRLLVKQLRVIFINTLVANRGNQGAKDVRDDIIRFLIEILRKEGLSTQISVLARVLQIMPQFLLQGLSKDFEELDELLLSLIKKSGMTAFKDLLARVIAHLQHPQAGATVANLEEYNKLFPVIELPRIAQDFQSDEVFAYMQVAGYNPLMLQRISTLDRRFPVSDKQFQAVMGKQDSLAQAAKEGRLYLVDYGILQGALNGTFPKEQKYLYAPMALFAVPQAQESSRLLRVVAIQCDQEPGPENPICTPHSPQYTWLFAKAVLTVADANFHEAVSHLARTHLFVGSFVVTTHRQLPDEHPVSLLLRPHFEGTLAINDAAQKSLIASGGGVNRLLSSTIDNSRVLAVKGLQTYGFNAAMLPKQLELRGVDDTESLPIYPYRDDALLVWNSIKSWVSDYLSLYYPSDAAVQNDTALQAWAQEAHSQEGGRVPDFGEANGGIQTLAYLIDALTLIIFTASAQHAAVNFPQKDIMSYAPAVPLAGYVPASALKAQISEQDYLALLPPLDQAQRQLNLLDLLGSIYYNRLGQYPKDHFPDRRVNTLLQKFQADLLQVEAIISQRNLERPAYEYLLPSKIPQSINI